eukprot:TRINITY_DN44175_c0_g1_i1.p1 TRINITY_DN44175_c0_g1~~TRINITY_DN44175_c0_g1_i1.p1  ORF type:complete len:447 (-),score=39.70 TRINITY_DN44175_c0_g1_i1:12-1352(-)
MGRALGLGIDAVLTHGVGWVPPWSDSGVYALIGAAAFFAGVSRLTIALTVIMIEITFSLGHIMPVMAAVMTAKAVADLCTHPLYHALLEVKCVPFLDVDSVVPYMDTFSAREVMSSPPVTIRPIVTVAHILSILRTSHNAFPVVGSGGRVAGLVSRAELLVLLAELVLAGPAPATIAAAALAQHRARRRQVAGRAGDSSGFCECGGSAVSPHLSGGTRTPARGDLYANGLHTPSRSEGTVTYRTCSSCGRSFRPHPSSVLTMVGADDPSAHPYTASFECLKVALAHNARSILQVAAARASASVEAARAAAPTDESHHDPRLRARRRKNGHVTGLSAGTPVAVSAPPIGPHPPIAAVQRHFLAVVRDYFAMCDDVPIVDVRGVMDASPFVVRTGFGLRLTYLLFRTMSMRHLLVEDDTGALVGIITRKNLLGQAVAERIAARGATSS